MKTSIITAVWNRSDLTHQFLTHHWRLFSKRPEVEIVMVNNGSTDDTSDDTFELIGYAVRKGWAAE